MAPIPRLNPKTAMNQAVKVAPILAPIIIRIDWARVIAPALAKLTIATVAALEDSAIAAIPAPEAMLEIGFLLARLSQVVNLSPVSFRIPLLSRFIP